MDFNGVSKVTEYEFKPVEHNPVDNSNFITRAELAIQYATEDRALADTYITLAKEEVTHMNRLHEQVMRVIAEYRNKNGEPPQAMTDIYNWEHKRIVKQAAQVQVVINSYK